MKLVKLYSNFPKKFRTVKFRDGLNVVLGTIKNPAERGKDTHNLGKTLFAQVIDFCLLKGKSADFFLFKHSQFEDYVFFLELRTHSGEYVTVRRSVKDGSKASFKRHSEADQDFTELGETGWDHWHFAFDASRQLLDGILDLTVLSPWSYRQAVSYSLRSQKDYDEPFKLAKFAGSHADWKPFLAHILGFNGQVVADGYTGVKDTTPPPTPTSLRVSGNELNWEVQADLQSELASFIIERDGQFLANIPDQGKNQFGRPVFQNLQYSDTPTQPLMALRFTDSNAEAGKNHTYRVIAVNTAGLKSPPSKSAQPKN